MRRFQLMNAYFAFVFVLAVATIAAVTLFRPAPATATSSAADAPGPTGNVAPATGMRSKQVSVAIDNFNFTPREVTVSVGDTVTWTNHDDVPHTASSSDDPAAFDSKALDTDDKFSFTFARPGTYKYYCKVHPHMTGSVVVR